MTFEPVHINFNVKDLDASVAFYQEALGMFEKRRRKAADGSFEIVFMGAETSPFELELTCLRDHPQAYDLGEGEFHFAFRVKDFEKAKEKHEKMGCICFVNPNMGIYFIEDPDGYWLEIVPERR